MTVVQFDTRYLRSLSQQCQRLLVEAMPHDLRLWTALPQPQFIRVANRHEFSLANHSHLGTEFFGFCQIVRGEEDRHPFARNQACKVITQCRSRNRIKPCCRLIQEDEWRMVKERPCHRELLFHAPAPLAHLILAAIPEIEVGEQFFDARAPFGGRHMVDAPVKVQIVFGGHALVKSCKLEQSSDAGTNLIRLCAGIEAKHAGLALRRFQEAKQEMDGGRFTSTIWSQKTKDNSCRHLQ